MRVAHFATVAPNRCGLYGTARDLILAERKVGIDAGIIDASISSDEAIVNGWLDGYPKIKDDSLKPESMEWARQADIMVRHSYIPVGLQNIGKPLVMAMHGRPESSFRLEVSSTLAALSTFYKRGLDERYKAFVTFWPEHIDIWRTVIPAEKVFYVPAPIDLDYYTPDGEKQDLGKHSGEPNILIADIWRDDIIPFNQIFAALKFQQKYCPTAKIHIVALQGKNLKAMIPCLVGVKAAGALGHVAPMTTKIVQWYRSADIVVTPHVIATRTIREPLACGIPVVAGSGNRYTPYTANPMDVDAFAKAINDCWQDYKSERKTVKTIARKTAEIAFNSKRSGEAIKEVFEKILRGKVLNTKKLNQRKVFIDVGGHLGESVQRFYREVPDACEYEIYSFEPEVETFKKLTAAIGHIKNVNLINACAGTKDDFIDFYVGAQNQNEGGTTLRGKLTGDIQYNKPVKIKSINFSRWLKKNIKDGDYVVLKMNIEGGEYDLMDAMLKSDVTGLIDIMLVQLHAHKFGDEKQRRRFRQIETDFQNKAKCKCLFKSKGLYPFNVQ